MAQTRWQAFFEDLERRGILDPLIAWIDEQVAIEDATFKRMAREVYFDDLPKLTKLHVQQGCIAAFAKIRKRMRHLGKRETPTPIRPTGTDEP